MTTMTTMTAATKAEALAERVEAGARALAEFAETLTEREWQTPLPGDGRKIGVVVHHVASMYPVEMNFVQLLARGEAIAGVSWNDVHAINAAHAREHDTVTKADAIALLRRNSASAADAIRALSEAALDRAAAVSLNADAPLTCQFFIEDHPLRHSYHHLSRIRAALGR